MQDITLLPLQASEFGHFGDWFHEGAENLLLMVPESISSMFSEASRPLAWKVVAGGVTLALVTVAVDSFQVGHLNLVVDPRARRKGVGSAAVRLLVEESEVKQLRGLTASVASSNTAAQKILIKNGFSRAGFDAEGNIEFRR